MVQHSLCFPDMLVPAPGPNTARQRAGSIVLITGGLHGEAAARLLESALADSGLAAHDPVEHATAPAFPAAHWRRKGASARLVVALGTDVAAALLGRPVSLALERGRVRALPDGGRLLVTEHPRMILRLADGVAQGREYRRLVNDLMLATPHRPLAA